MTEKTTEEQLRAQVAMLREALADALTLERLSQPHYGEVKDSVVTALSTTEADVTRWRADRQAEWRHDGWRSGVRAAVKWVRNHPGVNGEHLERCLLGMYGMSDHYGPPTLPIDPEAEKRCETCGGKGTLMDSGPPDHWGAPCPDCSSNGEAKR